MSTEQKSIQSDSKNQTPQPTEPALPQPSLRPSIPVPTPTHSTAGPVDTKFTETDVVVVLGRRGCGKSTLGRLIQEAYPRRIIFDSLLEYDSGEIASNFDEFAKLVKASQGRDAFTIIFQCDFSNENDEIVNQAVRLATERGDVLIVIEEIQLHSSHHSLSGHIKNALLIGRHYNIALLFTSQRAGEVHKTIISQANHIFVGQMHEKNDLNYLKSFIGPAIEDLPRFPLHEFLYFTQDGQIKIVKNRT